MGKKKKAIKVQKKPIKQRLADWIKGFIHNKKFLVTMSVFLISLISISVYFKVNVSALDLDYVEKNGKGYLIFTTTSTKATAGTKFKTIGFTAKFNSYTTTVKMEQLSEEDNGDGTVTTTFSIPFTDPTNESSNTIMKRFKDNYIYDDERKEIDNFFYTGGTITLDSIFTIVEGTSQQGGLDYNGSTWGEVYTTLDGIRNAREWAESTKNDFSQYFDRQRYFPPQGIPGKVIVKHIDTQGKSLRPDIMISAEIKSGENNIVPVPLQAIDGYALKESKWTYTYGSNYQDINLATSKLVPLNVNNTTAYVVFTLDQGQGKVNISYLTKDGTEIAPKETINVPLGTWVEISPEQDAVIITYPDGTIDKVKRKDIAGYKFVNGNLDNTLIQEDNNTLAKASNFVKSTFAKMF